MEMRMFQRSWHGIDLTSLPAAAAAQDKPASAEFYAQFYEALASGRGRIEPQWIEAKRRLGEAIETDLISPWKSGHNRTPRILALGAGNAIVEGVWRERDNDVTFHDCQEDSLAAVRARFPEAPRLIGDLQQIAPAEKYDLITAITIDYVMTAAELVAFLGRIRNWLAADGRVILYCASVLSFRQMAVETVKSLLGRYRVGQYVFWGYWRTPSEFLRAARRAGLRAGTLFQLSASAGRPSLRPATFLERTFPPLRDPNLVITFEQAT
jgi:hypothetical protein